MAGLEPRIRVGLSVDTEAAGFRKNFGRPASGYPRRTDPGLGHQGRIGAKDIIRGTCQRLPHGKTTASEKSGDSLYCPKSEAYPLQLKEIESPPGVLYWKGIEGLAEQPCLAFVGSRACSGYGLKHTKRLILELAEAQPELVIVSGMARGIDTVAHETALEAGLKTIAVLAGGLNHLYPPENKHLATRIQKKGALITEFPMAVKPLAKHFPIRNRVISGLSLGVVVTEARLKSGVNITAAFTLQQNREVFALPGQVDSEASAGTNRLISRQHAKLITRADEILEELQFGRAKTKQPLMPLFQAPKGDQAEPVL